MGLSCGKHFWKHGARDGARDPEKEETAETPKNATDRTRSPTPTATLRSCGFAEAAGRPYKLQVQTAGQGGAAAELDVACLDDAERFRREVLAQKRVLVSTSSSGGNAMSPTAAAGVGKDESGGAASNAAVIAVLERIEAALNEGLAAFRASASAAAKNPQ